MMLAVSTTLLPSPSPKYFLLLSSPLKEPRFLHSPWSGDPQTLDKERNEGIFARTEKFFFKEKSSPSLSSPLQKWPSPFVCKQKGSTKEEKKGSLRHPGFPFLQAYKSFFSVFCRPSYFYSTSLWIGEYVTTCEPLPANSAM